MKDRAREIIEESIEAKQASLDGLPALIEEAAREVISAVMNGGKVLVCGNGGSAADAQHLACEMVVRYEKERDALPAIALTTDTSILTAQSNDKDFSTVFSRQVEAIGKPGDLLIAISTSGSSPDVIGAARTARGRGMRVVGLTGAGGGELSGLCDVAVLVPSDSTPRIQELHITVIHAICDIVEKGLS